MVSKRQGADLSGSETEKSPPKRMRRARPDDPSDSDEAEVAALTQTQESNGKNSDAGINVDSGDDSDNEITIEDMPDMDIIGTNEEELEEKMREKHLAKIRAEFQQNIKKSGRPGSLGIIQKIDVTNFMCHKRLTIRFGERINFVIGHNGSGKSAILTALTIALGAKASVTGRGSGIKSFIKHGESVAEIEVTIKNCGPEAFKHDLYGDSIVVVRRFTKEGSSSYKLKSGETDKIISTKREELLAMCEQMQLQVDNPMNVLTQDSARQFLSASHPDEKYSLFLKGTHLTQLSEEYDLTQINIKKTNRILEAKKAVIPELKVRRSQWTAKVAEAQRAEGQRQRLDAIKGELGWAHVESKHKELEMKIKELAKLERDMSKVKSSLDRDQAELDSITAKVQRLESSDNSEEHEQDLENKKKELAARIKENKDQIEQGKAQQKEMNNDMKAINERIEDYKTQIAREREKLQEAHAGKQEQLLEEVKGKEENIKTKQERIEELRVAIHSHAEAQKAKKDAFAQAQAEEKSLRDEIVGYDNSIRLLTSAAQGEMNKYGNNLPALLNQIDVQQWRGRKPIGPFGHYIKLRDPQWKTVLQIQLGKLMSSFVVENATDRSKLMNMLKQSNNSGINVIVAQCDLFDYSRGEPPPQFATALRVLDFSDPWVTRVLINSVGIEKNLLAQTRDAGQGALDALRSQTGRGGITWTSDGYSVRLYDEGGKSSSLLEQLRGGDPRTFFFSTEDPLAEVEKVKARKMVAEARKLETSRILATAKNDGVQHERTGRNNQQELTTLRREIDRITEEKHRLLEELEDDSSVNIVALEQSLEEQEKDKESLKEQFVPVVESIEIPTTRVRPLVLELDEIRKKLAAIDEEKTEFAAVKEKTVLAELQAKKNVFHWQGKMETVQGKIAERKQEQETIEREFEEWTRLASSNWEMVEKPRSLTVLQKELDKLNAQIKEGEKARGYTLEEAQAELMEVQRTLQRAEIEIRETAEFVKNLSISLSARYKQWHYMRSYMSVRTKECFQFLLTHRGYSGTLDIDHSKGELNLKVRTDDQTGGTKDKDPRALSGGEKSYATICLLLALWKSLECPIRCLDEFDVFMDSVNRRVSLKLMIDQAKSTHEKQHILITPQELPIKPDTAVKIQRLNDPERNQGVLAAH